MQAGARRDPGRVAIGLGAERRRGDGVTVAEKLPPRELAKGTLQLYAVHFRRFQKAFEGKAVDQISIRMVAMMLDELTPRTANQCRALLIDVFNHAAAKGLCPDNPAASTINRIEAATMQNRM
ncbi:hypothetical protein SAMN05444064_10490 [Pseudomonas syringae]|nr:hypothetical protein SAMN05444514_10490 [Pseudomonas syringae]SFL76125.1 hypothetical protein SAMN05444064_10490 [Pseudomonas syringae]